MNQRDKNDRILIKMNLDSNPEPAARSNLALAATAGKNHLERQTLSLQIPLN
jgi:hypothetical protein